MVETFVIVHGAWHDAAAWAEVVRQIESRGHKAVAVNLPGRNIASGEKQPSLADYKQTVLNAIAAAGAPVVLAGHSFGGFTISNVGEAAPEKIKSLVYMAAYLPVSGESLQALAATDKDSKFTRENFVMAPDYTYAEVLGRDRALIFAGGASPELQRQVADTMVREPLAPMAEPVSLTAERFGGLRKVYIKTLRDNAVSPALQDSMIGRTLVARTLAVDSGHAVSLTRPSELAAAMIGAARA